MWRYCAAATVGTKHRRVAAPCEDAVACELIEPGTLVLALADGAGSADQGGRAALIATNAVIEALAGAPPMGTAGGDRWLEFLRAAVLAAREALLELATKEGLQPRAFATTLLVLVIDETGGAAAQIGDGVIVTRDDQGDWQWVFWPQHGEYANTTQFLTESDAEAHLQIAPLARDVADIALLSDGLEQLALNFQERKAFGPFFDGMLRPLLQEPESGERLALGSKLAHFLEAPRFGERTDDDLSLILASRRLGPQVRTNIAGPAGVATAVDEGAPSSAEPSTGPEHREDPAPASAVGDNSTDEAPSPAAQDGDEIMSTTMAHDDGEPLAATEDHDEGVDR